MDILLAKNQDIYHFLTYEHLSRREIQNRFFSERNDWLSAFEHINYVHAVLKK